MISSKEIWAPVLEKEIASALQRVIQSPEYSQRFVVDGLDALPKPAYLEHFLSQCMKQKNVLVEIKKNTFTNPIAVESALNDILLIPICSEGH